jgi:alanyl-tRNA synthetase
MRVIADHLRAATFLAVDGVKPSNKEQGYVMRRMMRRAILKAFNLGIEQNFVQEIAPVIAGLYKNDFPELLEREESVILMLAKEEKTFKQTLRKGLREFNKLTVDGMNGEVMFMLYDTYGFPSELSIEEAEKQEITVSENVQAEFNAKMKEQRENQFRKNENFEKTHRGK